MEGRGLILMGGVGREVPVKGGYIHKEETPYFKDRGIFP